MRNFIGMSLSVLILFGFAFSSDAANSGNTPGAASESSKATSAIGETKRTPLTKPLLVQLSIDPPGPPGVTSCTEDGILHLRDNKLVICAGTKWQPVAFWQ